MGLKERLFGRPPDVPDIQLTRAANLLCELEQPMPFPTNPLKMLEEILRAQDLLRKSGKDTVRQLADGHYMGHLDPEFWAHDEEIRIARQVLLQAIDIGDIPIGKFVEYGLNYRLSQSFILVQHTAGLSLGLNFQAREKLFLSVAEKVREELKTFSPEPLKGLIILFPEGLMARGIQAKPQYSLR